MNTQMLEQQLNNQPIQGTNKALETIVSKLEEFKAEDITTISLKGKTSFADHMVIASGNSKRHINSIATKVIEFVEPFSKNGVNIEGLGESNWVLIDASDVIIHLFLPEAREKYSLEKVWGL